MPAPLQPAHLVLAMQDMWHAAANAIERTPVSDVDENRVRQATPTMVTPTRVGTYQDDSMRRTLFAVHPHTRGDITAKLVSLRDSDH